MSFYDFFGIEYTAIRHRWVDDYGGSTQRRVDRNGRIVGRIQRLGWEWYYNSQPYIDRESAAAACERDYP